MERYILRIYRGHPGHQYWEEFELKVDPKGNIISSLMDIQRHPVNREGRRVAPVVWEQGCLEEVCGSCSMIVNGRPRQACTALIAPLLKDSSTITLAPMTKFPLIRDLLIDRSLMFERLKEAHAWVSVDDSQPRGPGPRIAPTLQKKRYIYSTCMTCGCCNEACPQTNEKSSFVGPSVIGQVELFNHHPQGSVEKRERMKMMMGEGGIHGCGNAQNCVKVCPKEIPLTDAIAAVCREATLEGFKALFGSTEEI